MEKNEISNGIKCDFQREPVATIENPAFIPNIIDATLKAHKIACGTMDTSIVSDIYQKRNNIDKGENNMSIAENKIATSFSKIVDDWYDKQLKLLREKENSIIEEITSQDELNTMINNAIGNFIYGLHNGVDEYCNENTSDVSDNMRLKISVAITKFGEEIYKKQCNYISNDIRYTPKTQKILDTVTKTVDSITHKLAEHKQTIKTILETCDSYNAGCEVLQGAEIFGKYYTPNDKPCNIIWNYSNLYSILDDLVSENK